MNNNFEVVKSLIGLLVKKAGFDLDKNYSEIELEKTKNNIKELTLERNNSNNKKTLSNIIENLKVREATFENNAEIVGKSLLVAYEENKSYDSIKSRIELLSNLAIKGTEELGVSTLYSELSSLEKKYSELEEKINTFDYVNTNEKEMDERYKSYLENKIESLNEELNSLIRELDSLRDVEIKDVNIVTKIKEYVSKLESDLERINKVLNSSASSNISFEIFERLENAKEDLEVKTNKDKETLEKAEGMLDSVRKSRINLNERKKILEDEIDKCTNKLNNVKSKIDENSYVNQIEKIIDVNELERIRLEIESLKNKRDALYVDGLKVKEELVKEWSKIGSSTNDVKEEVKEEKKEEPIKEPEVIKEETEETKEVKEEVKPDEETTKKHKRIELDW